MALMAKNAKAPNKIDFFIMDRVLVCYGLLSYQKAFQKSGQEETAVAITQESESVVKGEAVAFLPTLADESRD